MNDATHTISNLNDRSALFAVTAWRRGAKASCLLSAVVLALGACAGVDEGASDELLLGEHEAALTVQREALAEATSTPRVESAATSRAAALDDVTAHDDQVFDAEIETMSARAIGGSAAGVGSFGSLNAWGCWDSECCTCTMRECWPTGDGRQHCVCKQSTCSPCERCIWPY